jgi:hypothetical protein
MKSSFKAYKKGFSSITNYTRQDLTSKWLTRVSAKASNSASQEAVAKLASLVSYYTKPVESSKDKIDWDLWKQNIRTPEIVEKLKSKLEQAYSKSYNVEALASKSVVTSEKYEKVGLFLKFNHELWMKQYTDNLDAYYNALNIGDFSKMHNSEMRAYVPGAAELNAGWRETGYMLSMPIYTDDSAVVAASNQFRYSNSTYQPYYHPVCAWERGIVCKHALMSL